MLSKSTFRIIITLQLCSTVFCDDSVTLFRELVANNDYRLLEYSITTEDGYLLNLHRIVPLVYDENTYNIGRKPILLQHGLSGSSNNFFLNGGFHSNYSDGECANNFGFCLMATGRYDVWAGNTRANDYSSGRTKQYNKKYYWAFSFEQMAKYDMPAMIDFIRSATGHSRIGYVGHSQGTSVIFALLTSEFGSKYHDAIQPFVAWGPPIYIYNMTSKITLFRDLGPILEIPFEITTSGLVNHIIGLFCKTTGGKRLVCPEFLNENYGKTSSTDFTRLPFWLDFMPSTSSSWSVLHFLQLYDTQKFQHFDFGPRYNEKHYNQSTPPIYELSKFPKQVQVKMFNGVTDGLIPMPNAYRLWHEIDPSKTHSELTELSVNGCWNHVDYLFSTKAGIMVYQPTLEYLDKHY